MSLTFTTIQHGFRKDHELSLNEYALCDLIYMLSTNPDSKIKGWCYMSKKKMADELGLGKRTVEMILNRMLDRGFLEKEPETSYLKTSILWNRVYFRGSAETAHPAQKVRSHSAETAHDDSAETAHYNNKIDTNTDKGPDSAGIFDPLLKKSEEIFSERGLEGVFFANVQKLHSLKPVEVKQLFESWKKEHSALGTTFKTKQHLRNSFNKWISKSKGRGGSQPETVTRVSSGRMIG